MNARLALAAALLLAAVAVAFATGGVYTQTKHGSTATGVYRLATEPRGDCAQCHDQHASREGQATSGPYPYALFAPNDNALCSTAGGAGGCHSPAGALGIYRGITEYGQSSHSTSGAMVWPGPAPRARPASDAGICINCHSPHGRADANGLIGGLVAVREEGSCNACHDASGPASTDIAFDISKAFRHPVATYAARHVEEEGGDPARYAAGTARHSECEDCHNPHDVRPDLSPPAKPAASLRNQRVGRVAVVNGAAGTVPAYMYRAPSDPAQTLEYEICFKCHSSWTTQPAGQTNMAVRFNANNPSYHPVEAVGKNTNIRSGAFVSPWTATSLTHCSDCHGSDDASLRGPHGSTHRYILRAPYTASTAQRRMSPGELCFVCHRWDTYANEDADDAVQGNSRFNKPEFGKGHAFHVDKEERSCYNCHDSHGSTARPALIVTGRNPGIISYTQTADGGRCTPTCHGDEDYKINYPR